MTSHASASRAALGVLGTRAAIYPVKIVVTLIVAPLLGAANYGIYSFLILPGAVIMPLLFMGCGAGVRYQISSERYSAGDVALSAIAIGILHGSLTSVVVGALWKFDMLGETGRVIGPDLMIPVLWILPVQGVAFMMNRVMVGASWFSATNLFILLNNILPPIFLTLFVIAAGFGVQGAVAALVAAHGLVGVITVGMIIKRFRPRIRLHFDFLKHTYAFGLKAWAGALASRTSTRFDQIILGYASAPENLGVYRIAVLVAELVWLVPDSVGLPLFNRISQTAALKQRLQLMLRSHRILVIVALISGLGLASISWWAIPAFMGDSYADATWLLAMLIPGTVALVTSRMIGVFFTASGNPEKMSMIEIIGMVVSLGIYLTLIPALGVAGAAIGTSASYIVVALVAQVMLRRSSEQHGINLYGVSGPDLAWARGLLTDSFSIWADRLRSSGTRENK